MVILSSLKENIANYYESDDKNLYEIGNRVVYELVSNGLKVPEIDKLVMHILKTPDHAKFKWYMLDKSNHEVKCEICGVKEGLELHHLKPKTKYPELEFDDDNVCFLCVSCHRLIHHGGAKIMDNDLKGKIKTVFKHELDRRMKKNNKKSNNVLTRLMVYFF